jgi:hypothetical protein
MFTRKVSRDEVVLSGDFGVFSRRELSFFKKVWGYDTVCQGSDDAIRTRPVC